MNNQIDEMAMTPRDIFANDIYQHCPDLAENYCGDTHCVACLANALYNAGYRKQSEGEWLPSDTIRDDRDGRDWILFFCSACETNSPAYYKKKEDTPNFCPNCGAKMKGGAE